MHRVLDAGLLEQTLNGGYFFADGRRGCAEGNEAEVYINLSQPLNTKFQLYVHGTNLQCTS